MKKPKNAWNNFFKSRNTLSPKFPTSCRNLIKNKFQVIEEEVTGSQVKIFDAEEIKVGK